MEKGFSFLSIPDWKFKIIQKLYWKNTNVTIANMSIFRDERKQANKSSQKLQHQQQRSKGL